MPKSGQRSTQDAPLPWPGLIVYSAGRKGLFKIPASGGTPARIPTKDLAAGGYAYPGFLPDGKHVLIPGIIPQPLQKIFPQPHFFYSYPEECFTICLI